MTSEIEAIKTNEMLRRRKLRLQQVREQSKDIAKKLRLRAKVEKFRHLVNLDSRKESEYLQNQERLVRELEQLYAARVQNVGAGHHKASSVNILVDETEKVDLSKSRGKEATAQLRQNKQQQLDKQKKLLDRKLKAREAANEISREKSKTVINEQSKPADLCIGNTDAVKEKGDNNKIKTSGDNLESLSKNDMATQCDSEAMPIEWEPHVPKLRLPAADDNDEESATNLLNKPEKSKPRDLFALSEDMPSSLRTKQSDHVSEDPQPLKPSVTLVSEYLQNRNLRLREPDSTGASKELNDLQSIKQTILRTRASKTEGIIANVCLVHDEPNMPFPLWQPSSREFCHQFSKGEVLQLPCSHRPRSQTCGINKKQPVNISMINRIYSSEQHNISPNPMLRNRTPFQRRKLLSRKLSKSTVKQPTTDKAMKNISETVTSRKAAAIHHRTIVSAKPPNTDRTMKTNVEVPISRKNPVTVYNHCTKDSRDVPSSEDVVVSCDSGVVEDAYLQAMRVSSEMTHPTASEHGREGDHDKRITEVRNKVAMTKQSVEKEYNDTLAFLNSLSKNKSTKPIKTAYMDGDRQERIKDRRQRKMQEEYQKIERESRKQAMRARPTSKSPINELEDDLESRDFQYSWMPVPESDASLAVHTIPTTTTQKTGNSVKFSKVDSYHEYRSRHKHTPPTKETQRDRSPRTADNSASDESSHHSSVSSQTSVQSERKATRESDKELSDDAERIIIYKIIEDRRNKDRGSKNKYADVVKSMAVMQKARRTKRDDEARSKENAADPVMSIKQLKEGVYKTVSEKGDNMKSMQLTDPSPVSNRSRSVEDGTDQQPCRCQRAPSSRERRDRDAPIIQWESCDDTTKTRTNTPTSSSCRCDKKRNSGDRIPSKQEPTKPHHPETTTTEPSSTGTISPATSDQPESTDHPCLRKLADDVVQDTGKFFVGTAGFLKNNNDYEVVIQLRKKDVGVSAKIDDKDAREEIVKEVVDTVIHDVAREIVESSLPTDKSKTAKKICTHDDKISENAPEQYAGITAREANMDEHQKTQVSSHVPSHVPKVVVTEHFGSKTSTSACTQTSFLSPGTASRPILFHMSSSTSTTYMSPPDVIRPRYLSPHDAKHKHDEAGKPAKKQVCHCRKCLRRKNLGCVEINTISDRRRNLETPPNIARQSKDDSDKMSSSEAAQSSFLPRRCTCQKCFSKLSRKQRQQGYSSHCVPDPPVTKTVRMRNTKTNTKKGRNKSKLNPVIKNYVNRLLTLSKDGMKAIEVIDQECSAVSTPGSSILNIDTNFNRNKPAIESKISLQQVQQILQQKIMTSRIEENQDCKKNSKKNRKKSVHKVKSCNISKSLSKTKIKLSSTSTKEDSDKNCYLGLTKSKPQMPASPKRDRQTGSRTTMTDSVSEKNKRINNHSTAHRSATHQLVMSSSFPVYSTNSSSSSSNKGIPAGAEPKKAKCTKKKVLSDPMNTSTQTVQSVEADINIKLVENKLQNMEKIADLTEKCTQRLSDLAKVLEEVRKSKSIAYSHISTSDASSEGDTKSKRNVLRSSSDNTDILKTDSERTISDMSLASTKLKDDESPEYGSMLQGIPKPGTSLCTPPKQSKHVGHSINAENRTKGKPPPALSRIHLKLDTEDVIVPHELSTVVEVDSPMSVKVRSQSIHSQNRSRERVKSPTDPKVKVITPTGTKEKVRSPTGAREKVRSPTGTRETVRSPTGTKVRVQSPNKSKATKDTIEAHEGQLTNPDLLQSNASLCKPKHKSSNGIKLGTKMEMMDLKKFNDIMLKPFVSVEEFAKQCNAGVIDDVSNVEEHPRDARTVNDDLSSLHSEGSLPDVIGELLKRNIITEPFRFDTSSVNSATISSESSLSLLTLSKPSIRRDKKKDVALQNKENIGDTSDTMSISSNPDLENAFKKLGIGWASSTLKKTKERLALSSSSSNSSITQKYKFRHLEKHDAIGRENLSKNDISRNVEQQTSASTCVTVQEFLNKELAKKITFSTQPNRNVSDREFISLYETQMPEEMKNESNIVREERSMDGNKDRARTSTPVRIYKSMTYHSSSSSNNMSNGLFSNVDELSSVKATSSSMRNHSTSDKDDLTIPNYSLRITSRRDMSDGS